MKNPLRPKKFQPLAIDPDLPAALLHSASHLLGEDGSEDGSEAKLRFRNDAIRAELIEMGGGRAEVKTFKSEDGSTVTHTLLGNGISVVLRNK